MQKSAHNEEQPDLSNIKDYFNIVIIGDSSVGKTSILEKYVNNVFESDSNNKKIIEIYKKKISSPKSFLFISQIISLVLKSTYSISN